MTADRTSRTPDLGTAAREDRTRIDFAALRAARRARVLTTMEENGFDACLFGRETNVRYVAGQRRLWTSNTRAWLPTGVVVRATGGVHVMALGASLEDAPEDVPAENVFGRSFDPRTVPAIYAALPGLPDARRVAVDGLSIGMRTLIRHVCPKAEIVGAEAMMRELRRTKLAPEIECLRVAIAIAESSLQCAADALAAGRRGQDLRARYMERMAELGSTTFAQQGTFAPARDGPVWPSETSSEPFRDGASIVLAGGALFGGYDGSLARTWACGDEIPSTARALARRAGRVLDRLVDACRAGRTGADLTRVYAECEEPLPHAPIAYAVGMGSEGPLAGSGLGADFDAEQQLRAGMTVAVRSWVWDETRGHLDEDVVLVTDGPPERLTRMSRGPIARPAAVD